MSEAANPYAPTDLGTAEVVPGSAGGSPTPHVGLRLRVSAHAVRVLGIPERVSLVERDGKWVLVAGSEGEYDYSGATADGAATDCRIATRGCRAMDLEVGDRVRYHHADGEGVRIEVIDLDDTLLADGGATYWDLSGFQRDCLLAIRALEETDEAQYGQTIRRFLESQRAESINHGRLYPNLNSLVEYGFVETWEIDGRTKGFETTTAGRHALRGRVEALVENGAFDRATVLADGGDV